MQVAISTHNQRLVWLELENSTNKSKIFNLLLKYYFFLVWQYIVVICIK